MAHSKADTAYLLTKLDEMYRGLTSLEAATTNAEQLQARMTNVDSPLADRIPALRGRNTR